MVDCNLSSCCYLVITPTHFIRLSLTVPPSFAMESAVNLMTLRNLEASTKASSPLFAINVNSEANPALGNKSAQLMFVGGLSTQSLRDAPAKLGD